MTIGKYLIEATKNALYDRKKKLEDMGAPAVMIASLDEELIRLSWNDFTCGGDTNLLEEEFISVEHKKGRGGKVYHVFNGHINYFPQAKYGRYIKEA